MTVECAMREPGGTAHLQLHVCIAPTMSMSNCVQKSCGGDSAAPNAGAL